MFLAATMVDYFRRSVMAKRLTGLISYQPVEMCSSTCQSFKWAPPIIPITRGCNARAVRANSADPATVHERSCV